MLFKKKEKKEIKEYTMPDNLLLSVEDLNVHIKVEEGTLDVVRGISYSLEPGKTIGIVGESGCGKSVTSKEILRINPNNCTSSGRILFRTKSGKVLNLLELDDDEPEVLAIRGAEISMIFQEPMSAFSPLYTIGNQLSEILLLHQDITEEEAKAKIIEMMTKVGIANPEKRYDQYPHEFSGGMLQRALIAMSLSCKPSLLIADEPTTALDVTIQAQILELMKELQQEMGMAIVFITHDLGIVAKMCDTVSVMYLGEIVERGDVRQIFHNPQHPYTKGLLKSLPKLNVEKKERLATIEGVVPLALNLPEQCGFYDRCEFAKDGVCNAGRIGESKVEEGHYCRCKLYEKE